MLLPAHVRHRLGDVGLYLGRVNPLIAVVYDADGLEQFSPLLPLNELVLFRADHDGYGSPLSLDDSRLVSVIGTADDVAEMCACLTRTDAVSHKMLPLSHLLFCCCVH